MSRIFSLYYKQIIIIELTNETLMINLNNSKYINYLLQTQ